MSHINKIYTIVVPRCVQRQLDALPRDVYDRITPRIEGLRQDPRPHGVMTMRGHENEYRIRIGDYRVRYEIDDRKLIILLVQCRHRRDVYRV